MTLLKPAASPNAPRFQMADTGSPKHAMIYEKKPHHQSTESSNGVALLNIQRRDIERVREFPAKPAGSPTHRRWEVNRNASIAASLDFASSSETERVVELLSGSDDVQEDMVDARLGGRWGCGEEVRVPSVACIISWCEDVDVVDEREEILEVTDDMRLRGSICERHTAPFHLIQGCGILQDLQSDTKKVP
ncbi:hypothetical protein BCR34DRAFT_207357 [Clohesyomyces aquaticus]|uniref:Uncharacterized protein n=1 Tax=Clohesyomyces aquaticus TaxID=1231657 RepID=A0A1Y2A9H7_9PLEO|nr:hypothetical protein BCR34DRAFT_207357 [Clohesyomyces aquaticus]